jgi:hypothetical protein
MIAIPITFSCNPLSCKFYAKGKMVSFLPNRTGISASHPLIFAVVIVGLQHPLLSNLEFVVLESITLADVHLADVFNCRIGMSHGMLVDKLRVAPVRGSAVARYLAIDQKFDVDAAVVQMLSHE